MNKALSDNAFFVKSYLHFLWEAKTRYSVHSPYLFKLVQEVIRPGAPGSICGPVETLRERLKSDGRTLVKTDWGSGGYDQEAAQYEVKIRQLARSSALPSYRAARLFNLVRFVNAQHILELGTSLGITTGYLAKANPDAQVITLEGCPQLAGIARENMAGLGLKNVTVVHGRFEETLHGVLEHQQKLDLVFFDGNHRYKPTLEYFRRCLSAAHQDSVFVFDDIHYSREMEAAWQEILSHPRVKVSIDLFHMGWVFFREELSREHFILRYP